MNVLIFVMTILMLLTIITYGRLETFRTNQGYELLFEHYMTENERAYANHVAEKKYLNNRGSKKEMSNTNEPATKTPKATSRVSVHFLIDEKDRAAHQAETGKLSMMLKKLIQNLYSNQSFYQELEKKRPTFVGELISAIENAAQALPQDSKIKRTSDLSNLNLDDEELNVALYKILNGAPTVEVKEKPPKVDLLMISQETGTEIEKEADKADQDLEALEAEEYTSPKGYSSLKDFITVANAPKVRIYLAPRQVLKAIYNDDNVVDEIIKTRQDIFKNVNNGMSTKDASEALKGAFDHRRDPNFDDTVLDYNVTKTNPKDFQPDDP